MLPLKIFPYFLFIFIKKSLTWKAQGDILCDFDLLLDQRKLLFSAFQGALTTGKCIIIFNLHEDKANRNYFLYP